MDDFDVQGKERELDELLSEVKSLLEEDEPLREDPMEDAGLQDEASEGPMTADNVNIDFEKFYDDAAGFPDEGIYTPPTAYEQSKSAYQVARRAEYERMREAEREARDRQRVARDREEERVMRKLESRNRKTAETVKNPPRSDEEYARWLYEQGVEPETEEHRELLRQREQEQQTAQKPPKKKHGGGFLKVLLVLGAASGGAAGERTLCRSAAAAGGRSARRAQGGLLDHSHCGHRRGRLPDGHDDALFRQPRDGEHEPCLHSA